MSDATAGGVVLLSILRPYAAALGLPVTAAELAARLDRDGARRVDAPGATADDPAFLTESLPEQLRQAVEDAGPRMLAFLRMRVASPAGVERANRLRTVVSGHPAMVLDVARKVRMTPEDLMAMLLDGDAITVRVAEEVAARFGVDLAWLIGLDVSAGLARH